MDKFYYLVVQFYSSLKSIYGNFNVTEGKINICFLYRLFQSLAQLHHNKVTLYLHIL